MDFQTLLLNTRVTPRINRNKILDEKSDQIQEYPINQNLKERDYINELKQKMLKSLIGRWLNSSNPNKEFFSATEITECPKQTWYKLKGRITKEMLDYNKFFYLLDIYGRIGDTVHSYIYKKIEFESTEKYLVDKENHVSGRYDIYDNGNIIDIKSSQNITDVSPQLSIYYHLIHNYKKMPVKGVKVWWVLKNKIIDYPIKQIEELYPKYLNRAKMLYNALKLDDYPESLGIDEKSCQYCPIESWCKNKPKKHINPVIIDEQNKEDISKEKDDIIMLL